jgi:uncharacterized damage-inducible protein DinB
MNTQEFMLKEFQEEVASTKRILARVPADKLSWRPHPKSMTLGQLAIHIASIPGSIMTITGEDSFDVNQGNFAPRTPDDAAEIHAAFDHSIHKVEQALKEATPDVMQSSWHLRHGDKELIARPRIEIWRAIMLNHWYHHRGQLSVYLRLLDVPVPAIYGPSADDNPFIS